MKGLLINCALIFGVMLFAGMLWWPWVAILASASADIASVKGWIWLAGLVASGLLAAYLGWPLYEPERGDLGKQNCVHGKGRP